MYNTKQFQTLQQCLPSLLTATQLMWQYNQILSFPTMPLQLNTVTNTELRG